MNPLQKAKHFARHSVLLRKNLPVLPRVFAGYFKTLVLGQNALRTVEFTVTAECNVNCEMCYASRIRQKGKSPLSPGEYADIWRQARALGAFSAIISGGEPTMRKDLLEVVAALQPEETMIALVSNSTRLDAGALSRLKEAGVNVLHLSLNSVDETENDRMRDFDGHFQQVDRVARQAKDLGFEVCLSNVVSHGGLERSRRVAEYARRNGYGIVFSLACPTGNWAGAREMLLTPEDWAEVDRFMAENPYVRSDWTINFSMRKECPGGREKICISPYGDVMGCGMNFVSLGNVRDEPLETIWKRMCAWGPFRKRSRRCLIALDEGYLEEYLLPVAGKDVLPVPVDLHPVHPMPLPVPSKRPGEEHDG